MRPLLLSLSVLVAAVLPGTTAYAQMPTPRSERPYRGLFGAGIGDVAQSLVVSAELGGGYDDDLLAEARGVSAGQVSDAPAAGSFGRASGRLAYSLNTSHVNASMSGSGSTRLYSGNQQLRTAFASGAISLTPITIARNTTIIMAASAVVQPYNLQSVFPVLFEPQLLENAAPDEERGIGTSYYVAETATAAVSHQLARHTRFSVRYGMRNSDVPARSGSLLYQDIGGTFSHTLVKGLDLRLGYGYRGARYPSFVSAAGDVTAATVVPDHTIDAGVDFNRALSVSRRTTLTFGTGSTAYRSRGELQFRATGSANLSREIGRTWTTSGGFSRNVLFQEQLQQPVLADAVTVGVSGLFTRRLQFSTIAGVARGLLTDGNGGSFESYFGNSSLALGLTRFANLSVIYSYYQHRYDRDIVLPAGLSSTMERQSVRAIVTFWAPLLQRGRKPDASR